MRLRIKATLVAACSALIMTLAAPVALADLIGVSEEQIRMSIAELTFGDGGTSLICPATLEGELHETTFEKEEGSPIGYITEAAFAEGSCTGIGTWSVNSETLPWSISFLYWEGTLPSIDTVGLLLEDFDFTMSILGGLVHCRYAGPAEGFVEVAASEFVFEQGLSIPLVSGGGLCPSEGEFFGEGDLTEAETREPLEIVLAEGPPPPPEDTLQFEPAGSIELESLGALTFFGTEELAMSCQWVLRGSLTRAEVRLEEGASVGEIASTSHSHCSNGSVEQVLGTPWDIEYVATSGTLPSEATAVTLRVVDFAVELATFGRIVGCRYAGDLVGSLELSGANPYPTGLLRLTEPRLELVRGAGGCPAAITARGTFWLGPEQSIEFDV